MYPQRNDTQIVPKMDMGGANVSWEIAPSVSFFSGAVSEGLLYIKTGFQFKVNP